MGIIYKNSIPYGGGGDTESVELTQAEYDALTEEEKTNGTVYFITDAEGGGGGGGGSSLPSGGTTGQALVKKSDTDQDVEWADITDGASIQVDTMPTASEAEQYKIYQYVGATNLNFTNGYFYKCVFDYPDPTATSFEWMWKRINVQPEGSGSIPNLNEVLTKGNQSTQSIRLNAGGFSTNNSYSSLQYDAVNLTDININTNRGTSSQMTSRRLALNYQPGSEPGTGSNFELIVGSTPSVTMSNNMKQAWRTALDVGSGGSATLDEVLTNGNEATDKTIALKNSTDNGTTEIDSYGITQSYDDGAGLGNFAQFAGGSLAMSETNTNDDNTAYIGAKHMSMSSVDANGDPLNHFSMEWSEVANVDMSDDLKEAWKNALGGGVGVGMTTELLWELPSGTTVNPDNITLAHSITDYDQILVLGYVHSGGIDHLMTSLLLSENMTTSNAIGLSDQAERYVWYNVASTTQFTKRNANGGILMFRIYGINFGSKLDGTIGRWEKIGEWNTFPQNLTLDLSEYNAVAFASGGSATDMANSIVKVVGDWEVGETITSYTADSGGNFSVSLTKNSETEYALARSLTRSRAVLYGYKETGISDADVQRIAQEVPPAIYDTSERVKGKMQVAGFTTPNDNIYTRTIVIGGGGENPVTLTAGSRVSYNMSYTRYGTTYEITDFPLNIRLLSATITNGSTTIPAEVSIGGSNEIIIKSLVGATADYLFITVDYQKTV